MFYESIIWLGLLSFSCLLSLIQQIGYYGRGAGSQKMESYSFGVNILVFISAFFAGGFKGGVALILIIFLVNRYVMTALARFIFKSWLGYIPAERGNTFKI